MVESTKVTIINWIISILLTAVFIFFAMRGIEDLTGTYKIEETIRNTKKIRVALEKYYQLTGTYPDLTKRGVNQDLHLLDYIDGQGKLISFALIYGKSSLDKTNGNGEVVASNEVNNMKDFKNGTKTGGWNYNYFDKTGEIHPNLPEDIFGEKINWGRQ